MKHVCHAVGCEVEVKPELLCCGRHWAMVPKNLQKSVWDTYRPGQCDDREPSAAWHAAADWALASVAEQEGKKNAAKILRDSARRWGARAAIGGK